jgi:hypothetical protein
MQGQKSPVMMIGSPSMPVQWRWSGILSEKTFLRCTYFPEKYSVFIRSTAVVAGRSYS